MEPLVNRAPQPPPCVRFEDEHLLLALKPAGWNTHAPAPFAGEGLYDWLRHREPRWSGLSILHRLDKDTSGLLVFGKTPLANRSLTDQFTRRVIRKKYLLLTRTRPPKDKFQVAVGLERQGARYRPSRQGAPAETHFQVCARQPFSGATLIEAQPLTGRTHQIRSHAAEAGIPILGDPLYGGPPAPRLCLHAAELAFHHPATGEWTVFTAPPDFASEPRLALRRALFWPEETDACRLIHGAADGFPGWQADRLGPYLLLATREGSAAWASVLGDWLRRCGAESGFHPSGIYGKTLDRLVRRARPEAASPRLWSGCAAPDPFPVRENGVGFELSFAEGYSTGLFLDQRDNRRRLLTGHIAGDFPPLNDLPAPPRLLNVFAYTCAFSVCAALRGLPTTSLDLSRKYLEWGRRNFQLNGLDPSAHEFIHGDAFNWLKRLNRKGRRFEIIVLDPPTFSQSREHGVFRAASDFGQLAALALPLLAPGGLLLASTNAALLAPEDFLEMTNMALRQARRRLLASAYFPQPPDFPITAEEPAYLKTVWLRIA